MLPASQSQSNDNDNVNISTSSSSLSFLFSLLLSSLLSYTVNTINPNQQLGELYGKILFQIGFLLDTYATDTDYDNTNYNGHNEHDDDIDAEFLTTKRRRTYHFHLMQIFKNISSFQQKRRASFHYYDHHRLHHRHRHSIHLYCILLFQEYLVRES